MVGVDVGGTHDVLGPNPWIRPSIEQEKERHWMVQSPVFSIRQSGAEVVAHLAVPRRILEKGESPGMTHVLALIRASSLGGT